MNKPEKIIKFSITDDSNPNAPLKDRAIIEQTMDVADTVKMLEQFGIKRTRESLYTLWKTPYRNISRTWWINPDLNEDNYKLLLDRCPVIERYRLKQAIERRSVHVHIQPHSRKPWPVT